MMKNSTVVFFLMFTSSAFAMGGGESDRLITTAGGISSPSFNSALGQNPAGLTANNKMRILGAALSNNSSLNPRGYQGMLFLGNGSVGGGLGVQSFDTQNGMTGNATLKFGLAADVSSTNLSLGVSGGYRSGATLDMDLGLLWKIGANARLGLTAFDFVGGASAYGAGVAWDVSPFAIIAVDASCDPSLGGKTAMPALEIHLRELQLTAGYGFAIDKNSSSWIQRGGALGLGVRLSEGAHLQAYYNQIALYYLGLSFKI